MTMHALQRAKERYKLDLTFEDLREILNIILEGDAKFSYKCGSCSIYRLRYKHKLIIPVVSDNLDIITFNPVKGKAQKFKDKDGIYKRLRLKKAI